MSKLMTADQSSPWLRSASFDLSLVMGGALLTLSLPVLVSLSPYLLPVFFWIWIVGFEGSHFWATFSRTYFDRQFTAENSSILRGSLIFFVFPVLAVLLSARTGSAVPKDVYGLLIFGWSLYHNARQHYGFLNIYVRKSGNPPLIATSYKKLIYFAIVAGQIFFLVHFKGPLALSLFPSFETLHPVAQGFFTYVPYAVSLFALAWLMRLAMRSYRAASWPGLVPAAYTAICLVFYSVMFYIIAPQEPFFSAHSNNAQLLMMVTIMNSLFHNVQYHAIVWHFSQSRYSKELERNGRDRFGWAATMNSSLRNYVLVALGLGAVFGAIVWSMGDWPSMFGGPAATTGELSWIAYVLYFGIVGHHFYLDQKIWRPSVQKDLSQYLGLSTSPMSAMNKIAHA